jgi:hypothetical protein
MSDELLEKEGQATFYVKKAACPLYQGVIS